MTKEDVKIFLKEHPTFIVSFLGAYSVTIGMLYDVLLYSEFDIDILKYAGTEDFLFGWMKDRWSLVYVANTALFVLGYSVATTFMTSIKEEIYSYRYFIMVGIIIMVILGIMFLSDKLESTSDLHSILIVLLLNLFFGFIASFIVLLYNEKVHDFSPIPFLSVIWLCYVFGELPDSALKTAKDIKHNFGLNKKVNPVEIITIIKKGRNEFSEQINFQGSLIGSTSENYFLYIHQDRKTLIIPKTSVLRVEHIMSNPR